MAFTKVGVCIGGVRLQMLRFHAFSCVLMRFNAFLNAAFASIDALFCVFEKVLDMLKTNAFTQRSAFTNAELVHAVRQPCAYHALISAFHKRP